MDEAIKQVTEHGKFWKGREENESLSFRCRCCDQVNEVGFEIYQRHFILIKRGDPSYVCRLCMFRYLAKLKEAEVEYKKLFFEHNGK